MGGSIHSCALASGNNNQPAADAGNNDEKSPAPAAAVGTSGDTFSGSHLESYLQWMRDQGGASTNRVQLEASTVNAVSEPQGNNNRIATQKAPEDATWPEAQQAAQRQRSRSGRGSKSERVRQDEDRAGEIPRREPFLSKSNSSTQRSDS